MSWWALWIVGCGGGEGGGLDNGGDARDSGESGGDSGGDSGGGSGGDSGGDSRDSGGDSEDSGGDSRDSGGDSGGCAGLEFRAGGAGLGALSLGEGPSLSGWLRAEVELHNPCGERLRFLGHPDDWLTGGAELEALPPVYLEPGESAAVGLAWWLGAEGALEGALELPHDQPNSPAVLSLSGAVTAPLRLVAAGDGGHLLSSADYGQTAGYSGCMTLEAHTAALIRGVCAGGGRFVGVGGNAERAWWSSADGLSWESGAEEGAALAGCAWSGGQFVAADSAPLISADGRSWQRGSGSVDHHLRALAAGGGAVVAVGDSGQVAVTADGRSWDHVGSAGSASLSAVAYGGGIFVAAGEGGVTQASADGGRSWVESSTGGQGAAGLAWDGGAFLLGDGRSIYRSTDGVQWSAVNASGVAPLVALPGVVVGSAGDQLYWSVDGGFSWAAGARSSCPLGFLGAAWEAR